MKDGVTLVAAHLARSLGDQCYFFFAELIEENGILQMGFYIYRLMISHVLLSRYPGSSKHTLPVGQYEIPQQTSCQLFRLTVGQLPAGPARCGRYDEDHAGHPVVAGEHFAIDFAADGVPFVSSVLGTARIAACAAHAAVSP